jgi:fibronectin-binding autotransporter adhesin
VNKFFLDNVAINVETALESLKPDRDSQIIFMKPTRIPVLIQFICLLLLSGALAAPAATFFKQNNTTAINSSASWTAITGGTTAAGPPGSGDIGEWDSTVTAANTVAVGGPLTIGEIMIANPTGNVSITDATAANILTLNGVNSTGLNMSAATVNLTIGAPLTLNGSQTWNIASGRTVALNGVNAWNMGASVLTISGGGTLNVNWSSTTTTAALSSTSAGVVLNNSALGLALVSNTARGYTNAYFGTNVTLTLTGNNTMTITATATTGNQIQGFNPLTINPGSDVLTYGTRGSSSGVSVGFNAVSRNAGSMTDVAVRNGGTGYGGSIQCYGFPGSTVLGYATTSLPGNITNATDWMLPAGTNTATTTVAYTADTWASGNNVTVTGNETPASGSTINSLRFGQETASIPTISTASASGQAVVTVSSATGITVGAGLFVATNSGVIPVGATVSSLNGTAITLSANLAANMGTGKQVLFGTGANTVTLSGVNTITSGGILNTPYSGTFAETITGGTLTSGNTAANANGVADLIIINNNNSTSAGNLIINSVIADNGANSVGLTVGSTLATAPTSGATQLGGANTFTGPTYITRGTLQLTNPVALQSSTLNYSLPGILAFGSAANPAAFTLGGLSGTSNLALANISSAAVALSVGNNNASTAYSGVMSGIGGLTKIGSGTLTLSGANIYTGNTTLNAGIVNAGAAESTNVSGPFGKQLANAAGTIIFGGGALQYSAANQFDYSGRFVASGSQAISIDVNGQSVSFGTALSSSASLTLADTAGNGKLSLTTANNYSGGTTLNGGTLNFVTGALPSSGGITFNGGTLQWGASTTTDVSSGQTLTFNSGGATLGLNGNTVTLASPIGNSGTGALTVQSISPGGVLNLAGANTYTGNTTVNNGATLNVNNTSGSGTGSGNVTVASGGTLGGTGTISGNATLQSGASGLFTEGSPLTVSGTVTLNGNTITVFVPGGTPLGVGTYTLVTATGGLGASTVNGVPVLTGAGINAADLASILLDTTDTPNKLQLKVYPAGLVATWTDGNSDQNWSEAGNWDVGVPHVAGDSATFNNAGGSAVTLDASETVAGINFNNPSSDVISGSGTTLTLDNTAHGAKLVATAGTGNTISTPISLNDNLTATVGASDQLTLSASVANASITPETLTVNGAGTTVLSAANTYGPATGTVGTTLSGGGILQVGNNTALGAGDVSVTASSELEAGVTGLTVANNVKVQPSVTLTVDNFGNAITLGGVVSGATGSLTEMGSGTVSLNAVETYGGITTINSGAKLKVGGAGQLGSGAYAANIANSGTFDYNSSAAQALSGIISGGGALTQDGLGTLTLSGVDTYTGNTTINAGSLVISGAGQLNSGSYAGNIANAGTFTYGSSASQTLSGIISGTGALTQTGAGTLTLTGPNTYTGSTTLNAGIANAGVAESANVSGPFGKQLANAAGTIIFGGGTLQYSAANQFDYSGRFSTAANQPVIIDTGVQTVTFATALTSSGGSLTKAGVGTLTLAPNNTYTGATTINAGTLVLSGNNSASAVTDNATLQLVGAGALTGALTLNSGATLLLRADASTIFAPSSLSLQNAANTFTIDASPATSGSGNTLTFTNALASASSSDQTYNITGSSTYTLSLGAVNLRADSQHTPFASFNLNTLSSGPAVTIASITVGNWGNDLNFNGGGKVTVTGNLGNTSNGSLNVFVNNGTTVTLKGLSVKSNSGDAFKYEVVNGTLVLDNNNALTNNTSAAGLSQSVFILGAATNIFLGSGYSHEAGVLATANNNFNAAVYLGDPGSTGGLTLNAKNTNNVSGGDTGIVNSGTFTIGGQNTSGVNTYANPIVLGWSNTVKSVTLVAAPGGEVDFANVWANGADTTAGVTVGDATHTGTVKFLGANTYGGGTTVAYGTLQVNNTTGSGTGSGTVSVNSGATLGGSGTIAGNVFVAGATLPGATGLTNTIGGNLTYSGGAQANFDLSSSAANGGNDQIVLSGTGGNLTGNSVNVGINCGPYLDQAHSYVLFNLTGSGATSANIVSGFNATPVWLGTTPSLASDYQVQTSGTQVLLVYSGPTPPTITAGSVTPGSAAHNQPVIVSVTVTPGTSSINPNTGVTVNLTSINGTASQPLIADGLGDYTNTVAAAYNLYAGAYSLPVSIADNGGGFATTNLTLTVTTASQVWNGGDVGNSSNWSDNGNWTSGFAPGYGDTLAFAGTVGLAPVMNNSYTNASLTFNGGAGSFTIANSGGSTLTLAGTVVNVANNSANAETLNVPVVFNGTATDSLNAASGNLTLGQTINNSGNLLTVADSGFNTTVGGAISGGGGLTKSGAGTLTLNGNNSFTGATTITSGVLTIGGSGQLGGGTYSQTIADTGILNYNGSAAQTLSGIISGTGALTQNGTGSLALSVANTYSGGTTNNSGVLVVQTNSAALGTGSVIVNGGALMLSSNGFTAYTLANAFFFTNTSLIDMNHSTASQVFSGALSGSGTVIVTNMDNVTAATLQTLTLGAASASSTMNAFSGKLMSFRE